MIAGLVAAAVGILLGPVLRFGIVRYAVREGDRWQVACPSCARRLGPALLPTGRCRGCRERLGPPAGTVEAVAALALGALVVRGHHGAVFPLLALCWLAVVGTVLAFVDLSVHRLPNQLTAAAAAGVAVLLAVAALIEGRPGRFGWAVVCGLGAAASYLVLALLVPAGMGMGDVKLAVGLGLALGWWGGAVTVLGIAAGFLVNGVVGVVLLVTGRARRSDPLAHGPAMLVGALGTVALLVGG